MCIQFVACCSPPFSVGCIPGFRLVASNGQNHTGASALNSTNKVKRYGSFFAPGLEISFGEFEWQRWIVRVAILIRKFQHWVDR